MSQPPSPIEPQVFRDAVLDGVKLSSVVVPSGLLIHQIRNTLKTSGSTSSTSTSTSTSSSSNFLPNRLASNSIGLSQQLTKFLKLNGLLTFSFGLIYATLITTASSLVQIQKPGSVLGANQTKDPFKIRSNDYSIIGGALGGLITTTIFWHRGFLGLIKIIPGGMGIGVGSGLLTAYLQSNQSKLVNTQTDQNPRGKN